MAAGETYVATVTDDWPCRNRWCRGCGGPVQTGERVLYWSSDWKVGDNRVLQCQHCHPEIFERQEDD